MKDEIKEILDNLKYNIETNKNWTLTLGNSIDRWKLLLDYITNLQIIEQQYSTILSENAELENKLNQYENPDDMTLFYMWLDEKAKDKIKQLQEENKMTDEQIEKTLEVVSEHIYKSRIDKAIEYIDNDFNRFDCFGSMAVSMEMNYKREELLNILNGGYE